ncbi:hypothetical protein ACU8M5_03780 [Rhizobium leguminosarum]
MLIETATHLWLEAGNMSGGSRNQIEFSEELIHFFDDESRASEKIFIAFDSKVKAFCPLASRGQDYGQWANIWRLGLITEDKGGVSYPGRVIHFEKKLVGKRYVYLIEVVDKGSDEHIALSAKAIFTGVTGGAEGRAYGYW